MLKKKKKIDTPAEIPKPKKEPDVAAPIDPEQPLLPEEDPGIIPEENPFETPPFEIPAPGEGP